MSPADGKVMIAGPTDHRSAPPGEWQQITIFLSPMDVHMNRTPVAGRVTRIEYCCRSDFEGADCAPASTASSSASGTGSGR